MVLSLLFLQGGPNAKLWDNPKRDTNVLGLKVAQKWGKGGKEKGSEPDQTQWTQLQNDMAQNKGGIVHLPNMNEGWDMNRGENKNGIIASKNYPLIKEIFSVGL